MDKSKLDATGNSSDAKKAEQTSALTKDASVRRRTNIKMVQNVLLIWLNNNIDDNDQDYRNMVTRMRSVVNDINTFTDGEECIEFIKNLNDHKICMIIPGYLGQNIISQVHNMSQVDSIFIFCGNKRRHEQWAKEWSKIKGVFTEITSICEALKQASQQCEQNAISISFVPTSGNAINKNLDRLDPMFMYTQVMKEILLTIKFEQQHFNEFIDYCNDIFDENEKELKNVDQLKQKYRDETPIWWYTYECFLYPMLNRALRMSDVDIIIRMGFFIGDLHRQIQDLHKEQFGGHQKEKTFTVYRGQGLSKIDFEQMKKTKGGLMSFNNFLSTSKDRAISLCFAHSALANPDSMGILFVMTIDPSKSTAPFASIIDVSYFKDKEDEVLFSMHTVFRINDIKSMDENERLFQVDLTLTDENDDKDLRKLTDYIRQETFPHAKGWYRLGFVLLKLNQSEKAEEIYQILLNQTTNESEKAFFSHQIGWAKYNKGEYNAAIKFYEKAFEIYKNTLPPTHISFSNCYNDIGVVYQNMGEYSMALSYYEKALEIRQQLLPSNHPELAFCYGNIGNVYYIMNEYSKAISFHEKALEIQKQSLPPNHPGLAASYNNIGGVYKNIGEYSKALSCYEKALEIWQQSLPSNHPDLAMSYYNIGLVHENMGDYSKARSFYERAVDIGQQSLSSNHSSLKKWRSNLENVKKKL